LNDRLASSPLADIIDGAFALHNDDIQFAGRRWLLWRGGHR
jgi:hypothetical protein